MFDQAWIGYQNLFNQFRANISATGTDVGFDPKNVGGWEVYQLWQAPAANAWYEIHLDCGLPRVVDYFAVAGHNFGTVGANFYLDGTNDPSWATFETLVVFFATNAGGTVNYSGSFAYSGANTFNNPALDKNNVFADKLDSVAYRYFRLRILGNSGKPRIGVLALGQRLQFEQGFYGGFQVPSWNEDVQVQNNKSETGVFIGRSIVRTGLAPFNLAMDYLTQDWIYNQWLPFKQASETQPFIFSWGPNPVMDNAYCWQVKSGPNTAIRQGFGKVQMQIEGTLT